MQMNSKIRHLSNILISLQMRFGCYSRLNNLVSKEAEYRPLADFFERADTVIVAHDGVFCPECCGIIHVAKKHGKKSGVLGMSGRVSAKTLPFLGWLFNQAVRESDFFIFRERHSYESFRGYVKQKDKLVLAPDPAFAMQPAEESVAEEILNHYPGYTEAIRAGRAVVVATVVEQGVVYRHFQPELSVDEKIKAHSCYLAAIFDTLIRERDAFVVFLPHSVEDGFSDITTAEHVISQMVSESSSYSIICEDLEGRQLKSIIKRVDFLVGQRTHSVIGAVSVGTPFVNLTNRQDYRSHGIVGDMCSCPENVVDMEDYDVSEIGQCVLQLFDKREITSQKLADTSSELRVRLEAISEMVNG